MVTLHLVVGIAVIATNLIAGVWGGAAWLRREASVGFWYALRVAQVAVVLQVGLGALLLLSGREAVDGLGHEVGGGRCDDEQLASLGEADVRAEREGGIEELPRDGPAR